MGLAGRPVANTRRWFLASFPAICLAAPAPEGEVTPSAPIRYADPATEYPVLRLTDPEYTSSLPPYYARAITRRGREMLYTSDASGVAEAYSMDLRNGESRQLTETGGLSASSLTLLPDDRDFCYLHEKAIYKARFSSGGGDAVYESPDEFTPFGGVSITGDGGYAVFVERNGVEGNSGAYRLRMVDLDGGGAATLAEAAEPIADPIAARDAILYRRKGAWWSVDRRGEANLRLPLARGSVGPARWDPDGRLVLYLNYPPEPGGLHNVREFNPRTGEDRAVADTTQFVAFDRNADASMFVGASGSLASPYVLLLVRAVRREFTLCEHRASDPRAVAPVFSPDSQYVFFNSDQHGKSAIYRVDVEDLVESTGDQEP